MKKLSLKIFKYVGLLVFTSLFLVSCGGDKPSSNTGGTGGGSGGETPTLTDKNFNFVLSLKQIDDTAALQGLSVTAVETTSKQEFVTKTDKNGLAKLNLPKGDYQLSSNGYFLADSAKNKYKQGVQTVIIKGLSETTSKQLKVNILEAEKASAQAYAPFTQAFAFTLKDKQDKALANIPVTLTATDASFSITNLTDDTGKVIFTNTNEPLLSNTTKVKLSIQIAGDGVYWLENLENASFNKDETNALQLEKTDSNKSVKLPDTIEFQQLVLSAKSAEDAKEANKPLDFVVLTKMATQEVPATNTTPKIDATPASDWTFKLSNPSASVNFLVVKGDYQVQSKNFADASLKYYTNDNGWETDIANAKALDLKTQDQEIDLICAECVATKITKFSTRTLNVKVLDAKAKTLGEGVLSLLDAQDNIKHFAVNAQGIAKVEIGSGTYNLAYDTYYLEKNSQKTQIKVTPEEASFANASSKRNEEVVLGIDSAKSFQVKLVNESQTDAPLSYVAVTIVSEKYPNMKHTAIADKNGVASFYETDKIIFLKDSKFKIKLHPVDLDTSGKEKPLWVKYGYSSNTVTATESSASSFSISNKTLTVTIRSSDINNAKLVSLPLEFKDKAGNLKQLQNFVVYNSDSNSLNRYNFVQKSDALTSKYGVLVYTGKRYAIKKVTPNTDRNFYVEGSGFKEVSHTDAKIFTVRSSDVPSLQNLVIAEDVNQVTKTNFSELVTQKTTNFQFRDVAGNASALDIEGFLLVNANNEKEQHKIVTSSGHKTLSNLAYGQYYVIAKKHYVGEDSFVKSSDAAKLYTIYKDSDYIQKVLVPINTSTGISFTVNRGYYGIKNILIHLVDENSNSVKASFKTDSNGIAKVYSSQDFFINKTSKYRVKIELLNLARNAPIEYWFKANSTGSSGNFVLGEANASKIVLDQNYTGSFSSSTIGKQINLDFSDLKHFPSEFELFTSSLYSKFKLPIFTDQISILLVSGSPDSSYYLRMPIYKTDGTSEIKNYSKSLGWVTDQFDASSLTPKTNSYSSENLACKDKCGNTPSVGDSNVTTIPSTNVPSSHYEGKIKIISKDNQPMPNIGVVIYSSYYETNFATTNAQGIAEFKQQNAVRNNADIYVLGKKVGSVGVAYNYAISDYSIEDKTIKLDFNADKVAKLVTDEDYIGVRLHKLKTNGDIDWSFDYQTRTDANGVANFYPTDSLTPDSSTKYKISIFVAGSGYYWFTGNGFSQTFSNAKSINLLKQNASGDFVANSLSANTPVYGKTINATDDNYNPKPIDGLVVGVSTSSTPYKDSNKKETFTYSPINYTDKAGILYANGSYYYLTLPKLNSNKDKYYLKNGALATSLTSSEVHYYGFSGTIDCVNYSCFIDRSSKDTGNLNLTVNQSNGNGFGWLKVVAVKRENPNIQYQAVTNSSGVASFTNLEVGSYQFYVLGNFLNGNRSYAKTYSQLYSYNSIATVSAGSTQTETIQVNTYENATGYLRVSDSSNSNLLKNVPVALYYKGTLYQTNTGPAAEARFYSELPSMSGRPSDVEAKLLTVGQGSDYNMFDTSGIINEKPGGSFFGGAPNINPSSGHLTGYIGSFRKMLNIKFVDKFGNALTPYKLKACTDSSYSNCDTYDSYMNTAFNLPVFGGYGSNSATSKVYLLVHARKEDTKYSYIDANLKRVTIDSSSNMGAINTGNINNGTITNYEFYCPRCNPAPVAD